ncbi:MAG: phage terminase large subunit family protein [Eubacteriales bacterium]|nr:phage terminase large subunit family protein [Eubacteriales bacterium]MDD4513740.1 phage terminase large subunit family protein [Eubacteriales bacterium]
MTLSELVRATYQAFKPPKKQSVTEWADENRILVSETSSEPGRWRTDRAPYQREPMDAFTQPGIWKIVIMASAQVGKTELELNMMGRAIDVDPGPMLFVQPTDNFAEDFSKRRVATMIRACPVLKSKVYEAKSRDAGNTIGMKTFPGGSVTFTGANSPTELAGRPVRYEFMDEIDRFPRSAGTEGDPLELAQRRTETFRHNRKVVFTSTPTIKGKSKIESEYLAGTQEEWHVECPHCHEYHYIRFSDIQFEKTEYDENGEKGYRVLNVCWRCPSCKQDVGEYELKRCPAKWIKNNPEAIATGVRSFRLNAFLSPWSDWKDIVHSFLKAKNDAELLKVFYNTVLGETFEMRDRSGRPEKLHQRREHYNAEVPTGALVLTMGVDTQDNRLEYEIVGWSRDEESWGINHGTILGRPDSPGVWEEIDALLDREWKMKNGKAMRVLATFIDSGGHFTQEVYDECAKREHRRVFAIKGEGGESKQYVRMMKSKEGKREAHRFIIGVDSGKEAIMHATTIEQAGPKYMHYPVDYRSGYDMEYFRGLISEQMVFHRRGGQTTITWEKVYERNEPLDIRNYARAAFRYFNWNFDKYEQALLGLEDKPKPITRERAEAKKAKRVISKGITV